MARRKRLSPAAALTDAPERAPETKSAHPPIASLVADAAGRDALMEAADEHRAAREGGRLVLDLPLDAVEPAFLVRDRIAADDEEMEALRASIRERGQQTPIEVQDLGDGRYGLISGWRRLEALKSLAADDPKFGRIKAFSRVLETDSEAYIAMVEENEIRANLSYYERARIADAAAEKGVFPTAEIAVRELFRHASRPKRSKILSFLKIHRALGDVLTFPTAIGERAGLALVKALDEDGAAERIAGALSEESFATPEAEVAAALAGTSTLAPAKHADTSRPVSSSAAKPDLEERSAPQGVRLRVGAKRVELTGAAVTEDFVADLQRWLAKQLRP